MVKRIFSSCFAMVLLFMTSFSVNAEDSEYYVMTYAENQTIDYPTTKGAQYFADLVYERTDGRIKIIVKCDAELGTEAEVLKQLEYGGIDFARVSISQLSDRIPEYNVLLLPFLYESSEHMLKVLKSEIGTNFLNMAESIDMVGLSWYDADVRSFYTTDKPIRCLEDFAGMKIRIQESSMMEKVINALGGIAVQIPYGDVYACLERGLVEGAENNLSSYETMKHYEVAPYYTEDEHSRIPEIQLISKHTWEKLSEENQEIIRTAAEESAVYEHELTKERAILAKKIVIEAGAQVISISQEEKQRIRDAVYSIYEEYGTGYMDLIEEIQQMNEE
ncbi:MAG: TRAP transporter substrate-binding protein [Muricoprocola sp.]